MCEPTTLAVAGLAMGVLGTGMSVHGSIQQGKAASAAAGYNARMAQREAQMLDMQAKDAERRGQMEEERFRQQHAGFQGEQVSSLAASGVDMASGSPLQIFADTAEAGELDAQNIRYNHAMEAWGIRNKAQSARAQGEFALQEGRQAKKNAYISAGSSLLSGLGTVGMQYAQMKHDGMFQKGGGKGEGMKTGSAPSRTSSKAKGYKTK